MKYVFTGLLTLLGMVLYCQTPTMVFYRIGCREGVNLTKDQLEEPIVNDSIINLPDKYFETTKTGHRIIKIGKVLRDYGGDRPFVQLEAQEMVEWQTCRNQISVTYKGKNNSGLKFIWEYYDGRFNLTHSSKK